MNKKLMPLSIMAGLLIVTLAACSGGGDPLDGTSWTLTAHGGASPLPGTTIDITFEGGELSGSAGCNHYFGSYEIRGETISISGVGMTEMYCMEPEGVMEQESAYLSALSAAKTFQINGTQLQIIGPNGDPLTYTEQ
jgi:heat shock protein HslJ